MLALRLDFVICRLGIHTGDFQYLNVIESKRKQRHKGQKAGIEVGIGHERAQALAGGFDRKGCGSEIGHHRVPGAGDVGPLYGKGRPI